MTDKQIIIDGVDVKQCKYFNSYQKIVRNNECVVDIQNACIEEIKTKPCSQKHNCYFKNWQRKEQECEELKEEINSLVCSENCYKYKQSEQYKQTLAEIKEMCNSVENIENVYSLYDAALSGMYLQAKQVLQKINEVEDEIKN